MKLWERYLMRETLKVFFLFLASFYFLYAMIDYSMHLQAMLNGKEVPLVDLLIYYGTLFSKRCELLLPLALLIASVKVLCCFNDKNELLACQTAGIPLYRLTRPFFYIGLVCVALSYLNFQVLIPWSLPYITRFEKTIFNEKKESKEKGSGLQVVWLEDGSSFVYQYYDRAEKKFFDLFHLLSTDKICYMKTLSLAPPCPTGYFVDFIERNREGRMEKTASYEVYPFEQLSCNLLLKESRSQPLENCSITALLSLAFRVPSSIHGRRSAIRSHLYFKLVMPWLAIYVVLGAIPFCIQCHRNLPVFLIFAFTIFGFIAFFTLMDASVILGEAQVLPPFWALFTLPLILLLIFGNNFIKKVYTHLD